MDFSNKIIWITGASSGIGEALVYEFSKRNTEIIISSRKIEELERVKANCSNQDKIHIQALDLEKHDEIPMIAREVLKKRGRIDILINNAGITQRSRIKDTPLEIDKKIMNVNFFGTVCLTKAVLPSMLERKAGHIVVTSSLMGKFSTPLRSAYAASKHALQGFFDTLRAEVWKEGIRVTILCPGYVKTNVSINALTADGTTQNTMDKSTENGMMPEKMAKKMIWAIESGKEEFITGGFEVVGVYLKRFFPRLLSRIIRKSKNP